MEVSIPRQHASLRGAEHSASALLTLQCGREVVGHVIGGPRLVAVRTDTRHYAGGETRAERSAPRALPLAEGAVDVVVCSAHTHTISGDLVLHELQHCRPKIGRPVRVDVRRVEVQSTAEAG